MPVGGFPDGIYVGGDGGMGLGKDPVGIARDSMFLLVFDRDGQVTDSLAAVGGVYRSYSDVWSGRVPVTPTPSVSLGGGTIYVAEGDHYEVKAFDVKSNSERRIRWAGPDPSFSAVHQEALDRAFEKRYEGEQLAERRRQFSSIPKIDSIPVVSALIADGLGYLWVRRYDVERDNLWAGDRSGPHPNEWWVFDSTGAWIGSLTLPVGLDVSEIGEDWVLGLERDAFDVAQVVMNDLTRGSQ